MSIHCNAAGNGSAWMGAKGWSVFVSNNASTNSKLLADCLYDAAEQQKLRLRTERPGQKYWQQSLAICRDTNCPAVLTENLFQDNKEDVEFLLSKEGKEAIAKTSRRRNHQTHFQKFHRLKLLKNVKLEKF